MQLTPPYSEYLQGYQVNDQVHPFFFFCTERAPYRGWENPQENFFPNSSYWGLFSRKKYPVFYSNSPIRPKIRTKKPGQNPAWSANCQMRSLSLFVHMTRRCFDRFAVRFLIWKLKSNLFFTSVDKIADF